MEERWRGGEKGWRDGENEGKLEERKEVKRNRE